MIADGLGRAIGFRLAPGQAHELPDAIPLLDTLPGVPSWVVADRGYSSHSFREHIWSIGARPAIPAKSNEGKRANLRTFSLLMQWRSLCPQWRLWTQ